MQRIYPFETASIYKRV